MLTLTQVLGALLLFILCPAIGALPLTDGIVRLVAKTNLAELGTGNVGVSAAFYHGGRTVGILCVLAEAAKGIGVVLLARHYFPADPVWEIIALIALVMGRYWVAKGAGTTNVTWGIIVHDPVTAGLTFLITGIGFTIFREKQQGRYLVLGVLPVLTALRHGDGARIVAIACLCGLIAWIYQKMPDDLDLPTTEARVDARPVFDFFRGDRALSALGAPLDAKTVGGKAATLSQLRAWGYPVPRGYVLPAGDDPTPLIAIAQPSARQPLVVRSSAIGEDSAIASAAGQYLSILNVTSQDALATAIARCFGSYNNPSAARYRRDRQLPEAGMAVIVQEQVSGVYSGVAFSRDPIARAGDAVVIEALPGPASGVVSGQQTPESYRVFLHASDLPEDVAAPDSWQLPAALSFPVEGSGSTPSRLIQQVAFLARHLERRSQGMPQDVEWTFDGETLWLLQSRPITTLYPLWTRKIAAEVIPGLIRPLTWSINRPLTCGVWGEIFTVVLGARSRGLDFTETATLHHSRAYFNASLLGEIFLRMGLPPESLEFLTLGAAFSKPPLSSTVRNLPGLLRLLRREMVLISAFERDRRQHLDPLLTTLAATPADQLPPDVLLSRIETILAGLRRATYYSILAPLSLALRQALFKVRDDELDASQNPEVASLTALKRLAQEARHLLSRQTLDQISNAASLFAHLAEDSNGATILAQFDQFLQKYGYLSEVGTDIAVPTWQEKPYPVRELFAQFVLSPPPEPTAAIAPTAARWQTVTVQRRLHLKGQVTEIYSRLLAELRWSFLALETNAIQAGWLKEPGDIFFLTNDEVRSQVVGQPGRLPGDLSDLVQARRDRYRHDQTLDPIPYVVYGNEPPNLSRYRPSDRPALQVLQGIAASPGWVEGTVKVVTQLQEIGDVPDSLVLVVPYTDAGWAPLLAQASGLVAEVGGRLSHGAIVAREYGIPAVMNIADATHSLHDGQRVRIDGEKGTVEIL